MKRRKIFSTVSIIILMLSMLLPINHTKATTISTVSNTVAAMDKHLLEEMKRNEGLMNVVVTFHGDTAPTKENINLLQTLGIEKGVTLQALPIAGVLVTSDQVLALSKNEQVRSLYLNRKVDLYNAKATDLTGVDKVRTDDSMRKANGGLPVSGKGIGVVINDSGVDGTHPDLKLGKNLVQNVLGTTNMPMSTGLAPVVYVEDVANTDTNSGHGTHVAGTVGGTGAASSGLYEGVAPGADLIGYGSGGVLLILDLIGGFDYAIANQSRYNIRVITNSWGSNDDFFADDPVNIATKRCYDRGIVVLFAAGNSGSDEDTHNPYAKAPWVISVAAGQKDGKLVGFSSRGTRGVSQSFTMDGETWTWHDEPTITAPGVGIISTRAIAPLGALSVSSDSKLQPAHIPYYAHMSGTSMATPHAAGIVALLLDANPLLSPAEVKEILRNTATNMPGREPYEVGAGYINAYAAVDQSFHPTKSYGSTVNQNQSFNAFIENEVTRENYELNYNPLSTNERTFQVKEGQAQLVAKMYADGDTYTEEGGNPLVFSITNPNGVKYESGFNPLYSIDLVNTITVDNPVSGQWKLTVRAYPTVAIPEKVVGTITQKTTRTLTEIPDINQHPASNAVKLGISERLFDVKKDGNFYPDQLLTRSTLASYLVMGAGIRQVEQITDMAAIDAVVSKGASLKGLYSNHGVMLLGSNGEFNGSNHVTRAELAYSLIQSMGLQEQATKFNGDVTIAYKGNRLKISDSSTIPSELKGYVQLALDLGILNAYFSSSQGPYDIEPTIHANFQPETKLTRGDFAVAMTRFFNNY